MEKAKNTTQKGGIIPMRDDQGNWLTYGINVPADENGNHKIKIRSRYFSKTDNGLIEIVIGDRKLYVGASSKKLKRTYMFEMGEQSVQKEVEL
jgi:uncharacterized protein involved in high-affinity Fe2+ transport